MIYHSESLPSAISLHQAEKWRVIGVLDGVLTASRSGFLASGGKPTMADLVFVAWKRMAMVVLLKDVDFAKYFPAFWA